MLAGTSVVWGRARAVVYATGMRTEFGRIAHLTQTVGKDPSPLQREIAHLSRIVAVLAAGLGIALVPDFSAQAALRAGKLVEVLADWASVGTFSDHLYAIRPYASHVPRAVSVFVAWLREALAQGFPLRG